ncbi:hypothetical protein KZH41_02215 [Pseudomonas sp. YeP6b]|uniref:hypothetical protein n=1 Tax=Pseudomonas sp. YeP6b TaxID=2861775 RepID=UPI0021DB1D8E|nr:hypothetical protein [Pseudomonas sp. YeP6b]UXZ23064.1 hypothetical protein KZH41_02215 [Pseudomonas sp. YeP6b]
MKTVDDAEAKRIVRSGLDNWIGTLDDFQDLTRKMYHAARGVNSTEKRDVFVGKYLAKGKPRIYSKKVKIGISHVLAIESHLDESYEKALSKSEKQKVSANNQLSAQHAYNLSKKTTNVFVVKDGSKPITNELILLLFKTRGHNKEELFSAHSVGVIKKHCLERLIQRLGLDNIYDAINEILPAITWLEGSGSELAGRTEGYGSGGIKRHVPTPNGALLLLTSSADMGLEKPVQECSLITWIHKRQFKKNQEVTARDFKYAMTVNYYLSNPSLLEVIAMLETNISSIRTGDRQGKVFVGLHGDRYPADEFLLSLKQGDFLDFIIDFQKDVISLRGR